MDRMFWLREISLGISNWEEAMGCSPPLGSAPGTPLWLAHGPRAFGASAPVRPYHLMMNTATTCLIDTAKLRLRGYVRFILLTCLLSQNLKWLPCAKKLNMVKHFLGHLDNSIFPYFSIFFLFSSDHIFPFGPPSSEARMASASPTMPSKARERRT